MEYEWLQFNGRFGVIRLGLCQDLGNLGRPKLGYGEVYLGPTVQNYGIAGPSRRRRERVVAPNPVPLYTYEHELMVTANNRRDPEGGAFCKVK